MSQNNLPDWMEQKREEYRRSYKELVRNNSFVQSDSIIDEETLTQIKDEVVVEDYMETVEFDDEINLDEAESLSKGTDLNDTACDCEDDDHDCECPEMYYDFIPDEFGQLMDIEMEIDDQIDHVDDGVKNYLALKDAMFSDTFDVMDADLPEAVENDDPMEHGITTFDEAQPGRARVIFRRSKGRIVKRKRCKAGTRLQGNRCVPQTGTRKSALRRTGIKLKRAMRARGAGKKKLASLKRKITKKRVAGRARTYAGT
jgi:hypothetical protein